MGQMSPRQIAAEALTAEAPIANVPVRDAQFGKAVLAKMPGMKAVLVTLALTVALCLVAGPAPAWADVLASTTSKAAALAPATLEPAAVTGTTSTVLQPSVPMYRLYNPNSGEHFYTDSTNECLVLVTAGWSFEGTGWQAPAKSDMPVYRLYNPNAGDHHYTTSGAERDGLVALGWNDEGIGWYSDDAQRVAVHRLYNPNAITGMHHYTTSGAENDQLGGIGWNQEGIGWYAAGDGTDAGGQGYEGYLASVLNIHQARYAEFEHGAKGADLQKYIMLHDTEIDGTPKTIVDFWLAQQEGIATHFIVGKDGSVWQCVNMDCVAWHAGNGDSDSLKATLPNGYMNSYSIGIEMVHVGGLGGYPEAQLKALDLLIAYIDAHYGFQSPIIDHKMWRSTNSDTSAEFAKYLANYRIFRRHG